MKDFKIIKKIDVHAHVCPFPEFGVPIQTGAPLLSAKEQLAIYDKLNVECGVLLPLASAEFHFEQITGLDCKMTADNNPGRFLWFCGLDPRCAGHSPSADISRVLNHYKAIGAKGVGELTAQMYVDDPMMDNFFYHCGECDMPVTIHLADKLGGCYGIIDEPGLPRLEKMLKKHKKLKIFGHSAMFWSHISADVDEKNVNSYPSGKVTPGRLTELLREYDNLYCDLSAFSGANSLMRDPEHAARFIEEFSDRIMYGCDVCWVNQTFQYDFDAFLTKMVEDGMVSVENYEKLVRGNAARLLGL